jgi:hypothetical protein
MNMPQAYALERGFDLAHDPRRCNIAAAIARTPYTSSHDTWFHRTSSPPVRDAERMVKLVALMLAVLALTSACNSGPNAFTAAGRQAYRADVCGQYLSPESITPNYAGRGRSCAVANHSQ